MLGSVFDKAIWRSSSTWSLALNLVFINTSEEKPCYTPHFFSEGDASLLAGGATSWTLNYWFMVFWSKETRRRTRLSHNEQGNIHINTLEFLITFLQTAATVTRCENATPASLSQQFPQGYPHFPVLYSVTNNTATKNGQTELLPPV